MCNPEAASISHDPDAQACDGEAASFEGGRLGDKPEVYFEQAIKMTYLDHFRLVRMQIYEPRAAQSKRE